MDTFLSSFPESLTLHVSISYTREFGAVLLLLGCVSPIWGCMTPIWDRVPGGCFRGWLTCSVD